MKNEYGISPYQKKLGDAMINEYKQLKNVIQEQVNEYWVKCLNTEEQLKLLSNSLRALDSNRRVNPRAYAGLQQIRDELNMETGDTSQSTCLRVIDSEEDPELCEARGKGEASTSTCLRVVDSGEDPELQDTQDDFAVDDEETTEIETWVVGKIPTQNQWQYCPHEAGQALWQAAGQRRHQHHRRTNKLVGTASVDLSGPHQGPPMIGGKVGSRKGHYFLVLHL